MLSYERKVKEVKAAVDEFSSTRTNRRLTLAQLEACGITVVKLSPKAKILLPLSDKSFQIVLEAWKSQNNGSFTSKDLLAHDLPIGFTAAWIFNNTRTDITSAARSGTGSDTRWELALSLPKRVRSDCRTIKSFQLCKRAQNDGSWRGEAIVVTKDGFGYIMGSHMLDGAEPNEDEVLEGELSVLLDGLTRCNEVKPHAQIIFNFTESFCRIIQAYLEHAGDATLLTVTFCANLHYFDSHSEEIIHDQWKEALKWGLFTKFDIYQGRSPHHDAISSSEGKGASSQSMIVNSPGTNITSDISAAKPPAKPATSSDGDSETDSGTESTSGLSQRTGVTSLGDCEAKSPIKASNDRTESRRTPPKSSSASNNSPKGRHLPVRKNDNDSPEKKA